MSAKKFKFVSPGVFLSEIDNSQLPKVPGGVGPVVIGRTRRGPALKPVKVNSFQEFVEIFGEPLPGNEGEDPWRDGNGLLAPSYAPYAAQAYLRADINSPVTVVRLLGIGGDDADDSATGHPGWDAETAFGIFAGVDNLPAATGSERVATEATLVGIIYSNESELQVGVGGVQAGPPTGTLSSLTNVASGSATLSAVKATNHTFNLGIGINGSTRNVQKNVSFRKGSKFIRDVLNTSPVATNSLISTPPSGTLADKYWLGETFEETYEEIAREATQRSLGVNIFTAPLGANMTDFRSLGHSLSAARSGWVIPQYIGATGSFSPSQLERMFRFHAIQEGEQGLDISVCIENVKIAEDGAPSPYGRFDVVVKQRRGGRIYVVDSYENLNLNPHSDNFIARKIGDQYFEWDPQQKRNKVYGNYPNRSSYIRVEMGLDVGENGPSNPKSVPFGYFGPIKPADFTSTDDDNHNNIGSYVANCTIQHSGSTKLKVKWPSASHITTGSVGIDLAAKYVMGHTPYNKGDAVESVNYASVNLGMKDYLRKLSSFGTHAGAQLTGIAGNDTEHAYIFSLDDVVITGSESPGADLTAYTPNSVDFVSGSHVGRVAATATITFTDAVADNTTALIITSVDADGTETTRTYKAAGGNDAAAGQFIRTGGIALSAAGLKLAIEDSTRGHGSKITVSTNGGVVTLTQAVAGEAGNISIGGTLNDDANASVTGFTGGRGPSTSIGRAYTSLSGGGGAIELLRIVDSFSMPLCAGFDGVDVTEADPFNMRVIGSNSTTRNSYAHASVDRAIELIKDPEALEMNLASIPGITNTTLTTKLVQVCEARADALAIIDLPNVYLPPAQQKCDTFKDRLPASGRAAQSAKSLIARQINSSYGAAYYPWVKIRDTISARDVWVPPSVVALGVMGYTEQRDEVWFAPAGFNRGGLNEGNAGVPVLQVTEQLLSSERDRLYEANINPIASFVSEGLVVFGQKTLQMTPSALDRINVRRLLIFVKKEISRIANGLLFDQNVPATWNRFTGQVVPFLEGVKTRLGLTDFKVVLDRTTTTPDLVDRNIMYAKIFLKPARAIEFIAVDFVITRSGASFDD